MNHVLCQLVPYSPLDEDHQYSLREISLHDDDMSYPPAIDIMDDASVCDDYIDQMEETLIDQYVEL